MARSSISFMSSTVHDRLEKSGCEACKVRVVMTFDPNAVVEHDVGIYGLLYVSEEACVVLVPVPWDAMMSYCVGASVGLCAIFDVLM